MARAGGKPQKKKSPRDTQGKKKSEKSKGARVRIIPLGGLDEVGKNMMVLESGSDMVLIDAGLMFPEEEMLGIDLVLPDYSYVVRNSEKLRGIVITHGHEDHTGALPYLLKEVNAPVYGTRLTLGLIRGKLEEHRIKSVRLKEIHPGRKLRLGCFTFDFAWVNHSIPDGVALLIDTPIGKILHTGDFKFDHTPVDGRVIEFQKFAAGANGNVVAMLSDSTNAEIPGYTKPERDVGDQLREIFLQAKRRVIVASFASHIHRIQQILDVAVECGRKVAVTGRSMLANMEIAHALGYVKFPRETVVDLTEAAHMSPERVVVLCTGSQGEPLSALARMASHEHRQVTIEPGDTVVISASPVPGNEKAVSRIIDRLFKCGAEVYYKSVAGVHVSGHAAQEELKFMINLVRPKYFVPIHGEYRHLRYHANLARQVGMADDHIFVLENGDVFELTRRTAKVAGKINAGVIFVDGLGVGDIGSVVLRDRQQLSQDGIFIVVVTVSQQDGQVLAGPELISRGFVYVRESEELMEDARARINTTLARLASEEVTDWAVIKSRVRDSLAQFLYDRTQRRPVIIPIIVEI